MHSFFLLFLSFSFLLVLLRFYRLTSIPFFLFPRFMERFSLSLVGGNVEQKIQGDHWLWDTMLEEVVVGGRGDWLQLTFFRLLSKNSHPNSNPYQVKRKKN